MIYVLDSSAMIAWLRDEVGADVLDQMIIDPGNACFAHSVNLCEVYYDTLRFAGEQAADEAMIDLATVKVTERNDMDSAFWQAAAKLKATYRRVSLADCFALTLSQRLGGTLVTSDHHELDPIAQTGLFAISFFR